MRKKILILAVATVILALVAVFFWPHGGDVRDVKRIETECTLHTQEDIDTAMDMAIRHFKKEYEGCKLISIAYDEEETLAEIERQRERHGELKFLILVSSFYAGEDAEPGFERCWTYHDWKWIFLDRGDGWKLHSWGYA